MRSGRAVAMLAVLLAATAFIGLGAIPTAAQSNDQLILTATDKIVNGTDAPYLENSVGVSTFTIGTSTYAAVAASSGSSVQILDVTDPANVTPNGNIGDTDSLELQGAWGIDTFVREGRTYAAVTGQNDDGVQILDVTDPANIISKGSIANSANLELNDPRGITIFESDGLPYAAVAGYADRGVQILNLTDPDSPNAAGTNSRVIHSAPDVLLSRPFSIATFERSDSTYAIAASETSDAVQIINLDDPANPTAAGNIHDNSTGTPSDYYLNGARGIATFESDGLPYAAVTAYTDHGVQILNLTDPANPTAAGNIGNTADILLQRPWDIDVFEFSGSTYAAVTSVLNHGVQILDITDPDNPTPVGSIGDDADLVLDSPAGIDTFTINGDIYATVAGWSDDAVQIIRLTEIDTDDDAEDTTSFITTWRTASANQTVTFPGTGTYTVDWGDGSTPTSENGTATHEYAAADTYTVSVSGSLERFTLSSSDSDAANDARLLSIEQWGDITWTTMSWAFWDASNMVYNATDAPDLSGVTGMIGMFFGATAFDGDLSSWDVSGVTRMDNMFRGATSFNGDLSSWNTSSVTLMAGMFAGATAFNGNVSGWDTSGVTSMAGMFADITAFNGNVSGWDVSGVTNMNGMFWGASAFNQNISGWDVSKVTNISGMFRDASKFNQDLSSWNTSGVTSMAGMFAGATAFDGNVSGWNVSSVTLMNGMFFNATAFNGNVSGWNVTGVTSMSSMFNGATAFDGDTSGWNVSSVTNMASMFTGATAFNGNVSGWDVSGVTLMNGMFFNATAFNGNVSGWDVSSATNMTGMFDGATSFQQNLGKWYVVANSTTYDTSAASLNVTAISAQNSVLDGHDPVYGIDSGDSHDSELFSINNSTLAFKAAPSAGTYTANVTASGGDVFENGNNWDLITITVTGDTNTRPTVDAGPDRIIHEGGTFTLSGATATDDDGDDLTYVWSAPAASGVTISDSTTLSPVVTAPSVTSDTDATLTLTVNDGTTPTTDTVVLTVKETSNHFVTTWQTDAADESIIIPGTGTYAVIWGDGTADAAATDSKEHAYATAGTYTVSISGGLTQINLGGDAANAAKLQSIEQWGDIGWTVMVSAFRGATNMVYNAGDAPDLSSVTILFNMFFNANSFNGDLSGWDVSGVTSMREMFNGASTFNGNISGWDVSKVTDMFGMFNDARAFNGNITGWDTSKVTDMASMFSFTDAFNGNISGWDVSKVTSMTGMFLTAGAFDQNLGKWYVVPDSTTYGTSAASLNVTAISAQNSALDGHNPVYGIDSGNSYDSELFSIINNSTLAFKAAPSAGTYTANVTASGSSVFEDGNNWDLITITVTDDDDDAEDTTSFITTWQTTAANQTVTIPGTGTYTVDWGDGSTPTSESGIATHEYTDADTYTVSISGNFERINLSSSASNNDNDDRLRSIEQWGDIEWSSMSRAFWGASNMAYNATDVPDLSGVTGMDDMFRGASTFDGDLSGWDTSDVTNMIGTFSGASTFDGDVSDWDVSSVTSTASMFRGASTFDGDLSDWDVSAVTFVPDMFYGASSFNGNVSGWDVSSVTNMANMFRGATAFSQDLSGWDVSSVTSMASMFLDATAFNGNVSGWDVSSVTSMSSMFVGATAFSQDLSGWDVSNVTNMNSVFSSVIAFNSDISGWDVSGVTDMGGMFFNATAFNQDLSEWDVSDVLNMGAMFFNATAFNSDISGWDVSDVIIIENMFNGATSFQQNLGKWYVVANSTSIARSAVPGTVGEISAQNNMLDGHNPVYGIGDGDDSDHFVISGNLINMTSVDTGQTSYKLNVTALGGDVFENGNNWNLLMITVTDDDDDAEDTTSFVTTWQTTTTDKSITFPGTGTYTVDWGDGGTPTSENGTATHEYAAAGTYTVSVSGGLERINLLDNDSISANDAKLRSIEQWGNITWTDMSWAFLDATNMVYNADDAPDLSGVTEMGGMFWGASSFDGNLSGWDVSKVTNMANMFHGATAFNGTISDWDVSQVTHMSSMFHGATAFNGDLSGWDVSDVILMTSMFEGATAFNGDLSGWEVSGVTSMARMFDSASAFDGSISGWDVSEVTVMTNMFFGAIAFNQTLSGWDVSKVTDMGGMFDSASAFDGDLSGWDVSKVTNMGGMFHKASSFDGDISGWDVSEVTVMTNMFHAAEVFTSDLSGWDVSQVTNMNWMFRGASAFTSDLSGWDVSKVTDMSRMFRDATSFTSDLSSWDVSQVTDMREMFRDATSFNGNISGWDVAGVTDMYRMFHGASAFTSDLSGWDVSQVTNMREMFRDATSFNGNISGWDVSQVTDMREMFRSASAFNQNLGKWYVVANSTSILRSDVPGIVGEISAQNNVLRDHSPEYGKGDSDDSDHFEISENLINMTSSDTGQTSYALNVTALGNDVFGSDNTWHAFMVNVTDVAANQPPTADAGSPQTVNEGVTVTLDGSGSSDPDGDTLSYSWVSDSTPTITLTGQTPTFTAPQVGASGATVTFTLTVSDGNGGTDTDTVMIMVNDMAANQPPTADAGDDQTVNEGATVTLDGSGSSDPDGDTLSYSWVSDSTPTITLTGQTPTFTAPQVGASGATVTFTLTVSDGNGGTDTVTVTVTVLDIPPPPGTFTAEIAPPADSPTNQNPTFDVTFGSTIPSGNFTADDVATSPTDLRVSVSGSGMAFTITITDAPDGRITAHIPAGAVSDGDGDSNTASNRVSVTVDKTDPSITSARVSGSDAIIVSFSESVQGTTGASDWSLQGSPGVAVNSTPDSLSGSSVTLGLSGDLPGDKPELTLDYTGFGILDLARNQLGTDSSIPVGYPSSDRSRGQQAPPVIDIGSVAKSYPQSVPEWALQAAAAKHDPQVPIPPVTANGTFAFPLEINSSGYLLGGPVNTIMPHAVQAGQQVTIKVTVHDPTPVAYFAIYLNLPDDDISHLDSDAQIIWNYGQVYVVDRSGLMQDAAVTLSEDPDDPAQKTFTVTATFSDSMGQTNMAIRTWNAAGQLTTVQIFDAIDVRAQEPEPVAVDPEPAEAEPEPVAVDPEPAAVDDPAERDVLAIRMWSGFEPESISDAQLLASLGLDYPGADIPSWVMTELGPLAAKGWITVGEFKTALEYVLDA